MSSNDKLPAAVMSRNPRREQKPASQVAQGGLMIRPRQYIFSSYGHLVSTFKGGLIILTFAFHSNQTDPKEKKAPRKKRFRSSQGP